MMTVTAEAVARAVARAIPELACSLPADVRKAYGAAAAAEADPRGAAALALLRRNADLAADRGFPVCQDTGTVRVVLEIGPDVSVAGDVFSGVDAAVAEAYAAYGLRASVVCDALFDRSNTKTNTPAFCRVECVPRQGARLRVMLKGGGSDNACRVVMLPPSAGREGVVREVLACVREKAANACPPVVVGVGIGGTFDSVADLAAKGLWREIGTPAANDEAAALEAELLAAVNALGIGPGAQGGAATALAVHVETAPCHIAALPLAIELGCCALRRCTIELGDSPCVILGDIPSVILSDIPSVILSDIPSVILSAKREGPHSDPIQDPSSAAPPQDDVNDAAPPQDDRWAVRLTLPLDKGKLRSLRAGEACLLSGELFTLRDAGHARLVAEMDASGAEGLPYGLDGAAIFYAGPTPARGNRPFGAIGPTTASRMDAFAPRLYRAGVAATIGKGSRSADVAAACAETGGVYFTAIGGAAAALASCVRSAETVAYADLGTEALRRIIVEDFPVTVGIDACGTVFSPHAS